MRDTKFGALFSSGKEFGIKEAVVVYTVDAMSGSNWKFVPVDERLCSLHVRTNVLNFCDHECLCPYRA
jgi:hypothetical protein